MTCTFLLTRSCVHSRVPGETLPALGSLGALPLLSALRLPSPGQDTDRKRATFPVLQLMFSDTYCYCLLMIRMMMTTIMMTATTTTTTTTMMMMMMMMTATTTTMT